MHKTIITSPSTDSTNQIKVGVFLFCFFVVVVVFCFFVVVFFFFFKKLDYVLNKLF